MKKRMYNFNAEAEALIDQLKGFFGVSKESEVLEMSLTLAALSMKHADQHGTMAVIDPQTSGIVNLVLKKDKKSTTEADTAPTDYLLN